MTEPMRTMIWRASDLVLTIARSDGSCFNAIDTINDIKHEGVWSSEHLRFMPIATLKTCNCSSCRSAYFSDGVPVERYEGLV